MSDYRFQVVEHNGIPCLHVIFDEEVIDADGFARIIQTYIPLDDIQAAIGKSYSQMIIESFKRFFEVSPLTGEAIRAVGDGEEES